MHVRLPWLLHVLSASSSLSRYDFAKPVGLTQIQPQHSFPVEYAQSRRILFRISPNGWSVSVEAPYFPPGQPTMASDWLPHSLALPQEVSPHMPKLNTQIPTRNSWAGSSQPTAESTHIPSFAAIACYRVCTASSPRELREKRHRRHSLDSEIHGVSNP